MKSYKITHKNKIYTVKAKDSIDAIEKVKEVQDERLSPMTYRKLKEFGYNHNQWKNLSQEQANKIVASHEQKKSSTQNEKSENSQSNKTKSSEKANKEKNNLNQIYKNGEYADYPKDKLYGSNPELDKMVDSRGYLNRLKVAKKGYGLDKLVDDYDWRVREEVAKQGYGMEKLAADATPWVREEVAKQGYNLEKFLSDEYWSVRNAAKEQIIKQIKSGKYELRKKVADGGN